MLRKMIFMAALVCASIFGQEQGAHPNVIIIFADDLGYGDIGPFGSKTPTPNLDRLAKEGRKFTRFYVAQAVCSASRAALLTGCYPNRIGFHGALGPRAQHGLDSNEVTIAEMLKKRGYATGMAGKWHLGHHREFLPTRHGFDEYLGLPYSNDMWPHHPEAKSGTYPKLPLIENEKIVDDDVTAEDQEQLTTLYTERAVKFIEKNKSKPFFFYLAHSMPHVPIYVSSKFKGKTGQGLYADVIAEIDWSVGQVLDTLRKHSLERSTLVIFTSDNGPWLSYGNHAGSAGGLREGKGTSWEGGIRVPCIASWPGVIPAGTTSEQMWMTIDLLPTLAQVTQAELPRQRIDGLNVWPLVKGEANAKNPHASYYGYYEVNQLQAVFSGDGEWKLILPHTYRTLPEGRGGTNGVPSKYVQQKVTKPELYNIKVDTGERKNVAEENAEMMQRLLAEAELARAELGDALRNREGAGTRPAATRPGK